ncbi:DUF2341 domain-containing protein, partial [Patescibacteria group bacterium]|nr:DUF2341 domain-containing protein [Patescibacteria group bacterium]
MTTEKIVQKLNREIKRDLLRKMGCGKKIRFLALLKPTVSGWLVVFLLFQLIAGALLPFQISPTRPFVKLQETLAAGEGWLAGWAYRKPISVQNSTSTLTDYQVKIKLNPSNFDYSKASSTLADLRFTDSGGTTTLSYWLETVSTTATSTIWTKVPSLTGNSTSTIYLYYGNASAASASNGANTFNVFETSIIQLQNVVVTEISTPYTVAMTDSYKIISDIAIQNGPSVMNIYYQINSGGWVSFGSLSPSSYAFCTTWST